MSIILVPQPGSEPTSLLEWERAVESLKQYNLGVNNPTDYNFDDDTIKKGVLIVIGGSNYYCNADTAITGTASDYVKIDSDGNASYVTDLTGVTWNDTYNFYTDISGNAYLFDEPKAYLSNTLIGAFADNAYINSLDVHGLSVFHPAVSTGLSMEIRNDSYNQGNSSGSVALGFGFANHLGNKIQIDKLTANSSSMSFYVENGFDSFTKIIDFSNAGINLSRGINVTGAITASNEINISGTSASNFHPAVSTGLSLEVRNDSYNQGNSSGSVALGFGFSNHLGSKIQIDKLTANTTSMSFYVENGFDTFAKVLELSNSLITPSSLFSQIAIQGTGALELVGSFLVTSSGATIVPTLNLDDNLNPTTTPTEVATPTLTTNGATYTIPRGTYDSVKLFVSVTTNVGSPSYISLESLVDGSWESVESVGRTLTGTSTIVHLYPLFSSGSNKRLRLDQGSGSGSTSYAKINKT